MNAICAGGVPNRSGDPLFMTSLARGLQVMRALLEAGGRQTMAELSRKTGLNRAVVRRCLYTLGELGYASKEGHTCCLGPQIAIREGPPALTVPVRSALGVAVATMELTIPRLPPREELIEHYLPLLKTAAVTFGRSLQPSIPSLGKGDRRP